ncbi:MAG: hypothetical protein PHC28_16910 [Flavobacterium sp.]|uniref:hypothetical protein n=1 Tax=Flavobacterium sp. TaxID=239 RepID=UPI0026186E0D|nr:hypothetical protein [Flavobacterium sp.]MDD5152133.1 hypothetical protein [Flavobacterium sp.]
MKLKTIQLFVCGIAISLFITSCSSEIDSTAENLRVTPTAVTATTLKNSDRIKFKKETSLLIGRLLSKKEVREEVLASMKEVSGYGEVVSFGYLMGKNKGIRKSESEKINSKLSKGKTLFFQSLEKELNDHKADYPIINERITKKTTTSSNSRLPAEGDPFTDDYLQLYSPYNEVNDLSLISYDEYYTSEETEDGSPTNSGYYFNGVSESYVSSMNNDFIDTHPSFIVSVIDDGDLVGGVSSFTELYEVTTLPPPLSTSATLLTYNVNHNDIPDQDFITTRIPMIKINGTDWTGFGSTHQKFRVFRGGIDSGVTQNADGTITVTGKGFQIGEDFKTKRRNARKKNWINFDREFDVDWNQSESSHQIVVFSLHKWKSSDETTVNVKYAYKYNTVTGVWEGTIEPTDSTNVKVTSGSSIFRSNSELTRRQVLSTITGAGSTGKTYNDGGIEYNVKSVGIVDYYFKHWYTDL